MAGPKFISHRGNLDGPDPERENHPAYIEAALHAGYDVEVDIWLKAGRWYLGHDQPRHPISVHVFPQWHDRVIFHAKNLEALDVLNGYQLHTFFHAGDLATLTSKNWLWLHPFAWNQLTFSPAWLYACLVLLPGQDIPQAFKVKAYCTDEVRRLQACKSSSPWQGTGSDSKTPDSTSPST